MIMDESFAVSGITEQVDASHKYTTVYTEERRGPGNAHHRYAVRDKDGKLLGHFKFQDGAIKEAGVNGLNNEDLIAIVIDRLEGFQTGQFACRENGIAMGRLEEALMWLKRRTEKREKSGKEGTSIV